MAYVGNQPARGQWRKLTDISASFNGALTTFTTSVPPGTSEYYVTAGTATQLLISLGGVIQQPDTDYTVSTNSITFTTPPAAGLSFFGVLCGDALNIGTPTDASVTTAKLAGGLSVGLTAGSASTAALYFTGDPNTGVYSPGADQVAISTGGSGRLFVNSSGSVGIGTSSPAALFHVNGSSSGRIALFGTGTSYQDIVLSGTTDAGNGTIVISPGTIPGSGTAEFYTYFKKAVSGGSTTNHNVIIDGKVGIGTTSPSTPLAVAGGISGTSGINVSGGGWGVLPYVANSLVIDSTAGQTRLFATGTDASTHGNLLFFTGTTNGTASERLRITSAGLVGIGTSLPSVLTHLSTSTDTQLRVESTSASGTNEAALQLIRGSNQSAIKNKAGGIEFFVQGLTNEIARFDSSGRLGIGTTSPGVSLEVAGPTGDNLIATFRSGDATTANNAGGGFRSVSSATATSRIAQVWLDADGANLGGGDYFIIQKNGNSGTVEFNQFASAAMTFKTGDIERARIDSSGRLLVGTSTAPSVGNGQYARFVVQGNTTGTGAGVINLQSVTASSAMTDGANIGWLQFTGNDGAVFSSIQGWADGTSGTNDYPGRLTFSTTADGASSTTERMVIKNNGFIGIGVSNPTLNYSDDTGVQLISAGIYKGSGLFNASGQLCLYINRKASDGGLITFAQDGTDEGSITVSGTTVSYNGAHLSRWSQLPSGAERTEILRGTVLSNLDEMCEWGDEDNEQLNRMKVSDVEGDKNVSGVFQAWDDDDDTYINDFYCAMTGDFIIRIGADTTVERGDLLMSAGDGTAKPQDDDIIRSKTIAKVTSTNVSCTYDDGSYCVPCVLMAC